MAERESAGAESGPPATRVGAGFAEFRAATAGDGKRGHDCILAKADHSLRCLNALE